MIIMLKLRLRRIAAVAAMIGAMLTLIFINQPMALVSSSDRPNYSNLEGKLALDSLKNIKISAEYYGQDYDRSYFGDGWQSTDGCDTRNIILNRDMSDVAVNQSCQVISGTLHDPYTGKMIYFERGSDSSSLVQIDHVVALSNAWKTGAYLLSESKRLELANDPLELLAVDGQSNQQKSDGDASQWLPDNKSFWCDYVARQIAVKEKYDLWMDEAEYSTIENIIGSSCPNEILPMP